MSIKFDPIDPQGCCFSGGYDHKVIQWDIREGVPIRTFEAHTDVGLHYVVY